MAKNNFPNLIISKFSKKLLCFFDDKKITTSFLKLFFQNTNRILVCPYAAKKIDILI
jgi:hypothetical protein